ncbi:hypothetical protein F383_23204 [Gossypium arboreum]|uniref:Uncharacterized protein n=1 Tax=Gossypium arboreum TaxID=29729 RepID=A0A0B0NYK8_GOSAR|nr:hypothetical protein F383_23204 [Gossypium arboreum]
MIKLYHLLQVTSRTLPLSIAGVYSTFKLRNQEERNSRVDRGKEKHLSSHSGIEGNVGGRSHYQRNNSV